MKPIKRLDLFNFGSKQRCVSAQISNNIIAMGEGKNVWLLHNASGIVQAKLEFNMDVSALGTTIFQGKHLLAIGNSQQILFYMIDTLEVPPQDFHTYILFVINLYTINQYEPITIEFCQVSEYTHIGVVLFNNNEGYVVNLAKERITCRLRGLPFNTNLIKMMMESSSQDKQCTCHKTVNEYMDTLDEGEQQMIASYLSQNTKIICQQCHSTFLENYQKGNIDILDVTEKNKWGIDKLPNQITNQQVPEIHETIVFAQSQKKEKELKKQQIPKLSLDTAEQQNIIQSQLSQVQQHIQSNNNTQVQTNQFYPLYSLGHVIGQQPLCNFTENALLAANKDYTKQFQVTDDIHSIRFINEDIGNQCINFFVFGSYSQILLYSIPFTLLDKEKKDATQKQTQVKQNKNRPKSSKQQQRDKQADDQQSQLQIDKIASNNLKHQYYDIYSNYRLQGHIINKVIWENLLIFDEGYQSKSQLQNDPTELISQNAYLPFAYDIQDLRVLQVSKIVNEYTVRILISSVTYGLFEVTLWNISAPQVFPTKEEAYKQIQSYRQQIPHNVTSFDDIVTHINKTSVIFHDQNGSQQPWQLLLCDLKFLQSFEPQYQRLDLQEQHIKILPLVQYNNDTGTFDIEQVICAVNQNKSKKHIVCYQNALKQLLLIDINKQKVLDILVPGTAYEGVYYKQLYFNGSTVIAFDGQSLYEFVSAKI